MKEITPQQRRYRYEQEFGKTDFTHIVRISTSNHLVKLCTDYALTDEEFCNALKSCSEYLKKMYELEIELSQKING